MRHWRELKRVPDYLHIFRVYKVCAWFIPQYSSSNSTHDGLNPHGQPCGLFLSESAYCTYIWYAVATAPRRVHQGTVPNPLDSFFTARLTLNHRQRAVPSTMEPCYGVTVSYRSRHILRGFVPNVFPLLPDCLTRGSTVYIVYVCRIHIHINSMFSLFSH